MTRIKEGDLHFQGGAQTPPSKPTPPELSNFGEVDFGAAISVNELTLNCGVDLELELAQCDRRPWEYLLCITSQKASKENTQQA